MHTATQRQVGEHGPQIEYYWHHIPKAPDSFDFLLQESQVKGGHVNFVRVCSLLQSLSSRLYGALVRRFKVCRIPCAETNQLSSKVLAILYAAL